MRYTLLYECQSSEGKHILILFLEIQNSYRAMRNTSLLSVGRLLYWLLMQAHRSTTLVCWVSGPSLPPRFQTRTQSFRQLDLFPSSGKSVGRNLLSWYRQRDQSPSNLCCFEYETNKSWNTAILSVIYHRQNPLQWYSITACYSLSSIEWLQTLWPILGLLRQLWLLI